MKIIRHYLILLFYSTPVLARVLSGGDFFNSINLYFRLAYFLISRKTFLRGHSQTFKFYYKKKSFSLDIDSGIDVAVLAEIFVLNEYKWDLPFEPKSVLDLGAHWGDSSIFYSLEYPHSKIIAVEPSSRVYQRLKKQVKQFSNILPVAAAFGPKKESVDFFISDNSLGNSLNRRSKSDVTEKVEVLTMSDFCNLAELSIFDLVKFDIEGGEKYIFQDDSVKNYGKAFIGEIHLDLMDVTLKDIRNYFSGFELNLIKISSQRYIVRAIKI